MLGYPPVVFDSDHVPAHGKLDFCREEFGRKMLRSEIEAPGDSSFRLRMGAAEFGGVTLSWVESTPIINARGHSLIADGDDRFAAVMPLRGHYVAGHGGDVHALKRGTLMPMNLGKSGSLSTTTGGTFFSVIAPRAMMAERLGGRAPAFGVPLAAGHHGVDLVLAYLRFLGDSATLPPGSMRDLLGRRLAELLALVMCGAGSSATATRLESVKSARLAALLAHIERNFSDPACNIDTAASEIGASARTAQVLLEQAGMSFVSEVQRRRLDLARRMLAEPATASMRIIDIALDCGFGDISHFNRLFRRRFGDSPSGSRVH